MSDLTWSYDTVRQWVSDRYRVVHICQAPVEALFVDDAGLLALTRRGVERVRVGEASDAIS